MRDAEDIVELFSAFGPVAVRRMFGGAGIFAEGTMCALVSDGVIYLKAGENNISAFEREGLSPFTYQAGRGERAVLSYRRMPDRLYDDPDELVIWARDALVAARKSGLENARLSKRRVKPKMQVGASRRPSARPAARPPDQIR